MFSVRVENGRVDWRAEPLVGQEARIREIRLEIGRGRGARPPGERRESGVGCGKGSKSQYCWELEHYICIKIV